jgi:hypothetical protein
MAGAGLPRAFRGPPPDDNTQTSPLLKLLHSIASCASYLIHLEKTRVDLLPGGDSSGNRIQLRRVFVKRPMLDLVDPHD